VNRTAHLLLVEDNPADVELARETLAGSKLHLELSVASDGVQAIEYLRGTGRAAGRTRPDLILLDLNLPRKDGRQVLSEIKSDVVLRRIPVVVLTSSEAERDIARSYDLGANCYVTKPLDLRAFQAIVHQVETFWFTIVKLPPEAGEDEP
jgi:two-component system, chemotaxis family, response regulator Rcp1